MLEEQNSTISEIVSVKPQLELKKRQLSPLQHSKHNFSFGKYGESLAVRYLKNKNYKVIDCNVCFKQHEVDIVAHDCNVNELVFVEVKSRQTAQVGHPSKAVNKKKMHSMQQVAKVYIKLHQLDFDFRFDTITITGDTIEHFENITWNE